MRKLYGVSVGPGDPELITIKAKKVMERCNVIAVPVTAGDKTLALDIASGIVDFSDKMLVKLNFLMTRDREALKERHHLIAESIKKYLDADQDVAMLNLGDASLYSSFSYIEKEIEAFGYAVEVIPGVTSFCASAAKLKTSLTTMHQPLHIIPGENSEEVLALDGTKVVMKSGKAIKAIKGQLKDQAVQAVQNCGLPNEKICHSVAEIDDDASYFTTLLIQ